MATKEEAELFKQLYLDTNETLTRQLLRKFRTVLAGGGSYRSFIKTLNSYAPSRTCIVSWGPLDMAYKCQTCARVPTMALCQECFEPEKHEDHDYYLFSSSALGGKCDCGDSQAADSMGFCCDYEKSFDCERAPKEMLANARILIPALMLKFAHSSTDTNRKKSYSTDFLPMVIFITSLAKESHYLRDIICQALLDLWLIPRSLVGEFNPRQDKFRQRYWGLCKRHGYFNYEIYDMEDEGKVKTSVYRMFTKRCLSDVLYMCLMETNFHDKLLDLYLILCSNQKFRKKTARCIAKNQLWTMTMATEDCCSTNVFTDRFENLRLQAFSHQTVAESLVKKYAIIHLILTHLLDVLKYNFLDEEKRKLSFQFTFANADRVYRSASWDLSLILSNKKGALAFLKDPASTSLWAAIMFLFQDSDYLNITEQLHSNFDVGGCSTSYHFCLEIFMLPTWTMIQFIEKVEDVENILGIIRGRLYETNEKTLQSLESVSHHIPIHRVFALFMATVVRKKLWEDERLDMNMKLPNLILLIPIRLQSASAEMTERMWDKRHRFVEQGIRLYRLPTNTACYVDPDWYNIQFSCSAVDPDYFVQVALESFSSLDCLDTSKNKFVYSKNRLYMLEEVLHFFIIVACTRVLSSVSEDGLLRRELVTILAMGKRSIIKIRDRIPFRGNNLANSLNRLEEIVQEISTYKEPSLGVKNEPIDGQYILKSEVFLTEYDPVMVRMRCRFYQEYSDSLHEFYRRVEKKKLFRGVGDIWPPFHEPPEKLCKLYNGLGRYLNSVSLHAFLYVILYKVYYENMRESMMQLIVFLLKMSFSLPSLYDGLEEGLSSLLINCVIPFDSLYQVLDNQGLLNVFDSVNNNKDPELEKTHKPFYRVEGHSSVKQAFHQAPRQQPVAESPRNEDSILSLLLKFFKKLAHKYYKPSHMRGEEAVEYGFKNPYEPPIGGAEDFIGEVLDKLVRYSSQAEEFVRAYVEYIVEDDSAAGKLEKRKAKIKKAAGKKKQLLKKNMAEKIKKAIEANLKEEDEEEEEKETGSGEEKENEKKKRENLICSFCNEDNEHDLFLILLMTNTNMLGQREYKRESLMAFNKENTYRFHYNDMKKFIETFLPAYQQQPAAEWFDSIRMQSCGHFLHADCYKEYLRVILERKDGRKNKATRYIDREFFCPKCNQLCNCIAPFNMVDYDINKNESSIPSHQLIADIVATQNKQYEKGKLATFTKTDQFVHEILSNILYIRRLSYDFYIDLLRTNTELFLMGKKILSKQEKQGKNVFKPPKKIVLNSVFHTCNKYGRLQKISYFDDLLDILQPESKFEKSEESHNIALIDVKKLIIHALLATHKPGKATVSCVLLFFLNLYVLQLLSWMVFCGNKEEVKECIEKIPSTPIGNIISYLSRHVGDFGEFEDGKFQRKDEPFLKMFERSLHEMLMFCYVLYNAVLNREENQHQDVETMGPWQLYELMFEGHYSAPINVQTFGCFGWSSDSTKTYVKKFCYHTKFLMLLNTGFQGMERMLLTIWRHPKLVTLPSKYIEFVKKADYKNPAEIALHKYYKCLLCFDNVKHTKDLKLVFTHANSCGRRTCIFLHKEFNLMRIVWQNRVICYDSPYVNVCGGTKISKDMRLLQDRYELLENMWLFDCFDMFCKNWDTKFL